MRASLLQGLMERVAERPHMRTVVEDGRSHSLKEGEPGARRKELLARQFGAHDGESWRFDASTRAGSHTEAHLMEPLHNHRRYQKLKTLHRSAKRCSDVPAEGKKSSSGIMSHSPVSIVV